MHNRRQRGQTCSVMTVNRLLRVFALLLCLSAVSSPAAADTVPRDVSALKTLYQAWQPGSNMPRWIGDDPCFDNWAGVACGGPNNDQVTTLSLASLNLTGGIPTAIGQLASLTSLELSFNEHLGGSIPKEIGQLTSLTSLSIRKSGLTGSIPGELGSCVNLRFLALDQNQLTGTIPDLVGHLTELYWFDISENRIQGPLPVSTTSSDGIGLDNLTSAQHFHFNNNSITGSIPDEIFNTPKLLHLLLNGNSLQGSVPKAVGNAKTLKILRVDNNQLSGTLPAELNNVTSLLELNVNGNSFSGPIPDLSGLTNLLLLDLSNNGFDAQGVPSWMYTMESVVTLVADFVNINGQLNSSLFTLPSISTLSLSSNNLSGTLSFAGNSPSSLVLIDLENNNFVGLSGQPTVNGVFAPSISLRLAGNPVCTTLFKGNEVCTELGNAPFTWTPPPNSCSRSCDDGKSLNPNVCSCAFPLITKMQLTSPAFASVTTSFMSNFEDEWANNFDLDPTQVYIPFANFTSDGRMVFDLLFFPESGDALSTSVVQNITNKLSNNAVSLKEAPYLMRSSIAPPSLTKSSKTKTSIALIVGIAVAAVLVVCIIAIIVLYALRQKKRADRAEVSRPFASWGGSKGDPGDAPKLKGARWFSLAELKKATNNFSEGNEIGAGGYGKVYKAVLPSGEVVAVKRAEEGSMQGATEFKNEIELLSRVHHRNLVGLVGFCYEHNEEMLVYEFMSNGTLRDHLLGQTDYPLSWERRVEIALGSARGLAYLHELANPPIIHRDIKSSNILLDDKMVAKVADFGLSKLAPDGGEKKHVSTQVKGTLGYLDPEYYMTNQLTEKSDVYSFGVVLLESLSARPPIERGRYIVREVRTALDKGGFTAFKPLLDPFLGDYPAKQLEAMLDLALRCVEEAAAERPTMNEVVKELELIAGHSSGVHITMEPQRHDDSPYSEENISKKTDPSFEHSVAGFIPPTIEPK